LRHLGQELEVVDVTDLEVDGLPTDLLPAAEDKKRKHAMS
jgi:hypothetical protein